MRILVTGGAGFIGSAVCRLFVGELGAGVLNVDKLTATVEEMDVDRDLVRSRIREVWSAIDAQPKPLKWKLRAQVGDRLQWYELPEEVRSPYQPE